MNLDGLAGKAKQVASDNRDKIEEQADRLIDSKVQGENADRAKQGVDKALDSVLGKGAEGEGVEPAATPEGEQKAPEQPAAEPEA